MQGHMMVLHSAIVLLFTLSLGTSGAPGFDNTSRCITAPAVVGGTGSMTFLFRKDLNMSSDIFHAYVIRTGDTANVLQCDRRKGAGITCDIINSAFEHTTITNHSLTLTAANVTLELAGNYTLWILAGGSKEPPVECNFVVQNKTKGPPHKASSDILSIVVPVAVVLVVLAVLITGILILKRKNKLPCLNLTRNTSEAPQALEENNRSGEQVPLLETPEDVRGKLWYCLKTRQEDQHLLKFERNRVEGSFGIGRCPQNQQLYNLKVYHGKKLKSFRLRPSDNGFDFLDTERHFRTLSELVAFYKENVIIDKDTQTSVGKLVKPFERKPEGPWYVGKFENHEEDDVLLSEANGHGAFLIRESISKEHVAYTLAINIEGVVHTYRITVEDDGYKLVDADGQKFFPTLSALVEYYNDNDLYVHDGTRLGRLSKPAQVNPKSPCSLLCLRCCRCTKQVQETKRERRSTENQGTRSLPVGQVRGSL